MSLTLRGVAPQYDRDNGQLGVVAYAPHGSLIAQGLTANLAYAVRFAPSRPMTIVSMVFTTSIAAAADDAVDLGIYSSGWVRLASSGATTGKLNPAAGLKVVQLTAAYTVQPGSVYYAAFAAGTFGGAGATVTMTQLLTGGAASMFGGASPAVEIATVAASHPLPAPLTTPSTAVQAPLMGLREFA